MKRTGFKRKKKPPMGTRAWWKLEAEKMWSLAVKARDGYKCRYPGCTNQGKGMQAHHVCHRSTAPHMKFLLDVGITLCFTHHDRRMPHSVHNEHPEDLKEIYIKILGRELYARLYAESKQTVSTKKDYEALCLQFTEVIKENGYDV